MTSRARRWLLSGLSMVSGCCAGLGFEPFNLWWLVPVAVAAFVCVNLASTPRTGLLRGYLFGFGFNAVAFHWVAVLGIWVLLVFVVWLAVWYGLVGLAVSLTRRTPVWGFVGVAVWMGAEWISARWPFGGFGWGRLAFTASRAPIGGLFPMVSVTGVSCLIVTIGFLMAWVARGAWEWRKGRQGSAGAVPPRPLTVPVTVTVALVFGSTLGGLLAGGYDPAPDPRSVNVAVVQGNVPGSGITALGPIYTVENNHLAETIILAAKARTGQVPQPDFVVWPENSTTTDPYTNQRTTTIIDTAVDIARAPIFVGSITSGPGEDERQTVGLWWTKDGVTGTYAKRNLVPFGEWVPFPSVMVKLVPELAYVGAQSVPGTKPGVVDVEAGGGPLRVGDLICFEVAYDSTVDDMLVGDATTGGAQVVVVQTSNAMFTGTDQMVQQDAITRIRAMESRREILVSTTNSLAGLIDSHGRIVYEAELRTSDAQVFTVPVRTALTPAVKYRGLFDLASVVLPLLGGAGALVRRWRSRSTTGERA